VSYERMNFRINNKVEKIDNINKKLKMYMKSLP